MASSVAPVVERMDSKEAENDGENHSLEVTTTVQHEHSDSMITIRLSENPSPPATTTDTPVTTDKEEAIQAEAADPPAAKTDSIELVQANIEPQEDLLLPGESQAEGILNPVSKRASRVRFDMEDTTGEDTISRDPSTLFEVEEDRPGRSQTSSKSSLSPVALEDADTLETEMRNHAARLRSQSSGSEDSGSAQVDWAELDKNEEQEQRDEATDESTAFLLARLESENNALAVNPKAGMGHARQRSASRPPSFHQIKKLVIEPAKPSLRYSMLPTPPPMTELEFWSALVRDYAQTAMRLPTLTSNKIRSGIPPPLRGVVWQSIAGARDPRLEDEYIRLSVEPSPYEKLIHKDVGRSFPGVDMFRDPNGDGQRMLYKVLNAFSLWDQDIGYCQGLGFVVGPLLMHMGDKEAFCVLVRLMEHYDLRSCFLPNLAGLHLRIYQFQHLLSQHLPELNAHLEKLKVEPLYLSQWFLSFFGVTCPLPMLIRIYDVILTEGASETLMRVALSLMRRNATRILGATEFEDVMQFLLSRGLWDTYSYNADDLVNDFSTWTGLVTREGLQSLEESFKEKQKDAAIVEKPSVHTAASRFLGRFWAGASGSKLHVTPTLVMPAKSGGTQMHRTASKQSMASTLNSVESSEGHHSSASTTATTISQDLSPDDTKSLIHSNTLPVSRVAHNQDRDLHGQIEDLLTAFSNLQREHANLSNELQKEREEREEDRSVVMKALSNLRECTEPSSAEGTEDAETPSTPPLTTLSSAISDLGAQFPSTGRRSSLVLQTKHQLREEVTRWKTQYNEEVIRTTELTRQINEREREASASKEELREARARIADSHREKQRLEKVNRELKNRKPTNNDASCDSPTSPASATSPTGLGGLRELKLGRASTQQPVFSKRVSSLVTKEVLSTEASNAPADDALLLELVNAKTAEAVARQELEEVKGKLESLRKLISSSSSSSSGGSGHSHSASTASNFRSSPAPSDKDKASTPSTSSGGFFSSWGKRTASGTS